MSIVGHASKQVEAIIVGVDPLVGFVWVWEPAGSIEQAAIDTVAGFFAAINHDHIPPIRVQVVVVGDGPHHMDCLSCPHPDNVRSWDETIRRESSQISVQRIEWIIDMDTHITS